MTAPILNALWGIRQVKDGEPTGTVGWGCRMTLGYHGPAGAGTLSRPAGGDRSFRHKLSPVPARRFCLLDFRTPVWSNLWRDGSSKETTL